MEGKNNMLLPVVVCCFFCSRGWREEILQDL